MTIQDEVRAEKWQGVRTGKPKIAPPPGEDQLTETAVERLIAEDSRSAAPDRIAATRTSALWAEEGAVDVDALIAGDSASAAMDRPVPPIVGFTSDVIDEVARLAAWEDDLDDAGLRAAVAVPPVNLPI